MTEPIPLTLLDTDTLSAVMRRQPNAVAQAQAYLAVHQRFSFSTITRFEILRGLYAKSAAAQLARFEQLCAVSTVLPLSDAVVVRAAMVLATNNLNHYRRVPRLTLINWVE